MSLSDAEFSRLVEATVAAIEDAVDESDSELDFENNGGVLTLICEDSDTQVIVSSQMAQHQIWVAAKSGGYHCAFYDGADDRGADSRNVSTQWRCTTTDEALFTLLGRVCSEQSDSPVELSVA